MYDYLPQRARWIATAITNWMGDDGVLKRLRMEARLFNIEGDTTFIRGTVAKKYIKDRCALVDIEMKGANQRGDVSSPGFATVMLPSHDQHQFPRRYGARSRTAARDERVTAPGDE